MVEKVKDQARSILDNQYNKTTWSGFAGAILTMLFVGLGDYGIEVSAGLQGAITTVVMMGIVLIKKNK